jgi:hypothetical protein
VSAVRHLVIVALVSQPDDEGFVVGEAGDGDCYYEIPAELATPFLAAQAEVDRLQDLILAHVRERRLQEQPPIEEKN